MKTQVNSQFDREMISALMDGQLQDQQASAVLRTMGSDDARDCWRVYHLLGDVLRSSDLAAGAPGTAFVTRLNARLRQETRSAVAVSAPPPAPMRDVKRPASNDGVFRWKMVAGLTSFAAVTAIGWSALGSIGSQPGAEPQLAQGLPTAQAQVATLMSAPASEPVADMGAVMLRDPRLDELLTAHGQTAGASALGSAAGFLRNATFEGAGR